MLPRFPMITSIIKHIFDLSNNVFPISNNVSPVFNNVFPVSSFVFLMPGNALKPFRTFPMPFPAPASLPGKLTETPPLLMPQFPGPLQPKLHFIAHACFLLLKYNLPATPTPPPQTLLRWRSRPKLPLSSGTPSCLLRGLSP